MYMEVLDYDKESGEADVQITDDGTTLLVYCDQLPKNLHQDFSLIAFLPENIERTNQEIGITKNSKAYYSYDCVGTIVSRTPSECMVAIHHIFICLTDDVPKDLQIGDTISFTVLRLDMDF